MSSNDNGWGSPIVIVAIATGVIALAGIYVEDRRAERERVDRLAREAREDQLARDAREAEERRQARREIPAVEPPRLAQVYVAPVQDPSWQYASNDVGGTTPPPPLNQRFAEPPANRPFVQVQDRHEPSGPMAADPYVPPRATKPRAPISWPSNNPPEQTATASGDVVVLLDEWRREHDRGRPNECRENGTYLYRNREDPSLKRCLRPAS